MFLEDSIIISLAKLILVYKQVNINFSKTNFSRLYKSSNNSK